MSVLCIKSSLGQLSSLITSGSRGWAQFYSDSGALFLRMTNLPREGINLILSDNKYVQLPLESKEGKRTSIKQNDILISITAELGRIGFVENNLGEAYVNQHVALIRVKNSNVDPKYIAYYLAAKPQRNLWQRLNDSGAKSGLNLQTISNFPVSLPSLPEQKKIADIISTWDLAIEKVERLVEAKANKFKWLLNKLLSKGREKEGWINTKLGDVADIKTGNKDNQDKKDNGKYPFFVRSQTIEKINSYSFDGEAILIPREGKIGEIIHYINGKFDYHQRVYKISKLSGELNGKFLFYFLKQNFPIQAARYTVRATADSLRLPAFTKMQIYYPSVSKQGKIADAMIAAQHEIVLLKHLVNAYRRQKRSLMQKLLTGQWGMKDEN